jgi:flagellar hook-associated protein 3 FlgL
MRITTSMSYELATAAMQRQQSSIAKLNQQLATGRRVLTPSDDPLATNNISRLRESLARNDQYAENRGVANSILSDTDSTFQSIGDVIGRAKDLALSARNGSLSNSERRFIATELRGRLDELLGLANRSDAFGNHMFAGYQSGATPFARSSTGDVQYLGDGAQRSIQIASNRELTIAFAGNDVFEGAFDGNGSFVTAAASGNLGSGIVSSGRGVDPTLYTRESYEIQFLVSGGATTYSVINTTTGTVLSSGINFNSGAGIEFDGIRMEISGSPSSGDRFSVDPSQKKSVFSSIEQLINALEQPVVTTADRTTMTNTVGTVIASLDLAADHVMDKRAQVGAALLELQSLNDSGEQLALNATAQLSNLADLDYADAISKLSQEQMKVDAARQAFVKTQGLSLFDLL